MNCMCQFNFYTTNRTQKSEQKIIYKKNINRIKEKKIETLYHISQETYMIHNKNRQDVSIQ